MYSLLLRHLVLPGTSVITKSKFWSIFHEMLELEKLSRSELEQLQWRRFKALLQHAYQTVPFHRTRMDEFGLTPGHISNFADLQLIPPTTKHEIQANFPDRVVSSNGQEKDWRFVSTSGTANRLMIIHDFYKREMSRAATLRAYYLSGGYQVGKRIVEIPPDICSIVCGAEGESLDGVVKHVYQMIRHGLLHDEEAISSLRGRVERNWVYRSKTYQPFGPQGTSLTEGHMRGYVDSLRRDKPYLLKALPTYLYEISCFIDKNGLDPIEVDVVKPMGGSLTSIMRDTIKRSFRGQVREDYGSAEFGSIACDCDKQDGLHIFSDLFLIEVVNGSDHVEDGAIGRILVTDLSNMAMPMIRYDIGDLGRIVAEPHGCGRNMPRLWLEGRVDDALVNRKGVVFSSDRIMDFFYARPEVAQFQIVEIKKGVIDLLVVPVNSKPVNNSKLVGDVQEFFKDDLEIRLYFVKTIKPETSGKFRFIQSKSFQ